MTSQPLDSSNPQVPVKFVTKQAQYSVTDRPILVPANLKRYGLSEIINHLLGNETPIPFDFLIDGKLIRTSLLEYLNSIGLSTENTLQIEYILSVLPPKPLASWQADDWISCVRGVRDQGLFLVSSYDGVVRVFNKSGSTVLNYQQSELPLKVVNYCTCTCIEGSGKEKLKIFSGGLEQTVKVYDIDIDALVDGENVEQEKYARPLFQTAGHKGSIEDIAVSEDGILFATASFDSNINIYTTSPSSLLPPTTSKTSLSAKKRKVTPSLPMCAPIRTLSEHAGAVSCLLFTSSPSTSSSSFSSSSQLISGGFDHSIRVWDVATGTNTSTYSCEKATYCLDYNAPQNLIISGHNDRVIRLWDPRVDMNVLMKSNWVAHKNAVSGVKFAPSSSTTNGTESGCRNTYSNEYHFASSSYDGRVCVWDLRAANPLFVFAIGSTEGKEPGKLFSVDWCNRELLAGGEDKLLGVWDVNGIARAEIGGR